MEPMSGSEAAPSGCPSASTASQIARSSAAFCREIAARSRAISAARFAVDRAGEEELQQPLVTGLEDLRRLRRSTLAPRASRRL